jgi:hypothetical protein
MLQHSKSTDASNGRANNSRNTGKSLGKDKSLVTVTEGLATKETLATAWMQATS